MKTYEDGLNEAWDLARKLTHPSYGGYSEKELKNIFGTGSSDYILTSMTSEEVKEKIQHYENINEIRVGVIMSIADTRVVVVKTTKRDREIEFLGLLLSHSGKEIVCDLEGGGFYHCTYCTNPAYRAIYPGWKKTGGFAPEIAKMFGEEEQA